MMRALLVLQFSIMAAWPAHAAQDEVVTRAKLDPASNVVVGQPVHLSVDVLFKQTMPFPPLVRPPEANGAQIFAYRSQGMTIREHIGGDDFVGQEFDFVVIPRRAGDLAIPGAAITLLDPAGNTIRTMRGDALRLAVALPAGLDASEPIIASNKVVATQDWSPDPGMHFAPGGALTRTIERAADGAPALGLADFTLVAPKGVRIYADPPTSNDRVDRGDVTGRRSDRVIYVFEETGTFQLPALTQQWWDLNDKQVRTEALPGVVVTVRSGAASGAHFAWSRWFETLAAAVVASAVLMLAVWLGSTRLRALYEVWRRRRAASETAARRRLGAIARTGDPSATYESMCVWRARFARPQAGAADEWSHVERLSQQLEAALFGRGSWTTQQGRALSQALMRISKPKQSSARISALPPLNPPLSPTPD